MYCIVFLYREFVFRGPGIGRFGRMAGRKWSKENRLGRLRTANTTPTKKGRSRGSFRPPGSPFPIPSRISRASWILGPRDRPFRLTGWSQMASNKSVGPFKNRRRYINQKEPFLEKLLPAGVVIFHSFKDFVWFLDFETPGSVILVVRWIANGRKKIGWAICGPPTLGRPKRAIRQNNSLIRRYHFPPSYDFVYFLNFVAPGSVASVAQRITNGLNETGWAICGHPRLGRQKKSFRAKIMLVEVIIFHPFKDFACFLNAGSTVWWLRSYVGSQMA